MKVRQLFEDAPAVDVHEWIDRNLYHVKSFCEVDDEGYINVRTKVNITNDNLVRIRGGKWQLPVEFNEVTDFIVDAPRLNSTYGFPLMVDGTVRFKDCDIGDLQGIDIPNRCGINLEGMPIRSLKGIAKALDFGDVSEIVLPFTFNDGGIMELFDLDSCGYVDIPLNSGLRMSKKLRNDLLKVCDIVNKHLQHGSKSECTEDLFNAGLKDYI